MRVRPMRKDNWTWGRPAAEKECVEIIEKTLWKRITEDGLNGVRLFGTMFSHRVVPLAVRLTKMWEYTGLTDPDRVSMTAVPDDKVWSWLDMVLKVGNQWVIKGLPAFSEEHPPNLGLGRPQSRPHLPKGACSG
ncbi:uncharacterized protein LOC112899405 [Panicum hallii]|uniref:uncharacterized protein LOC112899405 n=1 Tax=Panicum hallii TaxID=206008 RepID=UPI000DF4DD2A|nr:uncharacterized protein LOC112899405 [Panicum hallii]